MNLLSRSDFGTLIAYVLPGFTIVWAGSVCSPELALWLGQASQCSGTFSGFLYVVVASLLAGLTASTVRWALLDALHHRTGIAPPNWKLARLGEKTEAFEIFIEIHYRYYQFYANMIVAIIFAYVSTLVCHETRTLEWRDLGSLCLVLLFFAGSRDSLRKYYQRVEQLLSKS